MKLLKLGLLSLLMFALANTRAGSSLSQNVDFYGHPLHVSFDQDLKKLSFTQLNQAEIATKLKYFRNSNLAQSIFFIDNYTKIYDLYVFSLSIIIRCLL